MRMLAHAALGIVLIALVLYTVGLGVYAVASTAPALDSQPTTAEQASETLAALGLAELYPFRNRFVDTPHGRMHYVEEGSGPVLLCLHGNPTWSFLYRDFVTGLSDTARVVAPDLIGFGLSSKLSEPADYSIDGHIDDVAALITALDLRDVTLVLQDWGGPIGIGVALRQPERIRAIVAMNTLAFMPDDGELSAPLALRLVREPVLGELLVQGLGVFNRVFVPGLIRNPEHRNAVVRAAYDRVQGNWQERAGTLAFPRLLPIAPDQERVRALLEQEDRYLRGFRGPVLLIWGGRDPLFGPLLAAWQKRLPRADVLELDDAGHYLQEDAPERVVPRIREFLRASQPASGRPARNASTGRASR